MIFHSLPPYSPDLNKIENSWSWLKSRIRHQLTHFDSLREAIENVLRLVS
ncbi:transposase [Planktothrix sp. PCC 11201]